MRVFDPSGEIEESPPLLSSAGVPSEFSTFEWTALKLYFESGSLASVARKLDVSVYELTKLSRTEWWKGELIALQREALAIRTAKLTKLLSDTIDEIDDRIKNGDVKVLGTGQVIRAEMSADTLVRVFSTIFDKRQLLLGMPTHIDATASKLEELTEKLKLLGAAQSANFIEVVGEDDGTETE